MPAIVIDPGDSPSGDDRNLHLARAAGPGVHGVGRARVVALVVLRGKGSPRT